MSIRSILTLYLARLFCKMFLLTSIVVLGIIIIANVFDALQTFKNYNLHIKEFWSLVLFKAPYIFNEVTIIVSLVATVAFIQAVRSNNELLIIISSGIPIGRVFVIPVLLSLIFGLVLMSVNGSLSPYFLAKYKNLDDRISGEDDLSVIVFQSGVFFSERFDNENRIVQVKYIDIEKKKLGKVTIIRTDLNNNFLARIDADEAILDEGVYRINNASINYNIKSGKEKNTQIIQKLVIPTGLVVESLKTRFDPPRLIGLWNLKNSIKKFKKTGLNVEKYQVYYYKQILKPLGLMVMSLVACCFVTLNLRNNSNGYVAAASLIIGLITYFLQEILLKILIFNNFSVIASILIPIIVIGSISAFVILHFQEA
ncbi:MAG: hypothetical protein DGJ47_000732 [Rickettsiaceae bacterium]